MLGMSAAVLQGLHEMRNPSPPKFVEVTEAELRQILSQGGVDPIDVDIGVKMVRAGAALGGNNGVRYVLKSEAE